MDYANEILALAETLRDDTAENLPELIGIRSLSLEEAGVAALERQLHEVENRLHNAKAIMALTMGGR